MPRVLVAGKVHQDGLALLRGATDIDVDYVEDTAEAAYAARIGNADGLLIRTQPLTAETIACARNLKIVSRHGVGYDSVAIEALNARQIPLAIVGDINSRAVAEHAMMMILASFRRLKANDNALCNDNWAYRDELEAREVFGKRLLIIGFGRIGRRLAAMAYAFGMRIDVFDPFVDRARAGIVPVTVMTDLNSALANADCISVHAPKSGTPIIGASELAMMKPGAIVVNTSRGGVVDEPALIEALREGRIGAAGLDVFDPEPPAPDNPLLSMDSVILTPHIAGLTWESGSRTAVIAARNILDYFDGKLNPMLVVNAADCGIVPDTG